MSLYPVYSMLVYSDTASLPAKACDEVDSLLTHPCLAYAGPGPILTSYPVCLPIS